MGYDRRRDEPERENLFDAGRRGLARGLDGLRDLVSQIGDPTAMPRPKPVSGPARAPRRTPPPTTNGSGAREPAVDVFHEGSTIRVVADMPGADPATLSVHGVGERITIAASGPARRYQRTIGLPAPVQVEAGAPPTFINGIMEVLLPVVRLPEIEPDPGLSGPDPGQSASASDNGLVTPVVEIEAQQLPGDRRVMRGGEGDLPLLARREGPTDDGDRARNNGFAGNGADGGRDG